MFKVIFNNVIQLNRIHRLSMSTFQLPEKCLSVFNHVINDETRFLVKLFRENNYEIRVAGGAVRDILGNKVPHDIDFATDATPTEMKVMFENNNIRLINANGESHGTITARINDKDNFEITTLRIDKVTDGRRAEVEFTKDWCIDSERRDLTINSMFLDMDGLVYDYFGGVEDLRNSKVKFVGDCNKRIQEDYLRILRYFRFYGRISKLGNDHDENILMTMKELRSGLANVSGERIWMELSKIISGNFAPQILTTMQQCDLLPLMGFSQNHNLVKFHSHFDYLRSNGASTSTYLGALINSQSELSAALKRLKFSNDVLYQIRYLLEEEAIFNAKFSNMGKVDELNEIFSHFKDEYLLWSNNLIPRQKLHNCQYEFLRYINRMDVLEMLQTWEPPQFPVKGHILSVKWNLKGKNLGVALKFLRLKWKEANYPTNEEELLLPGYKEEFFMNHCN